MKTRKDLPKSEGKDDNNKSGLDRLVKKGFGNIGKNKKHGNPKQFNRKPKTRKELRKEMRKNKKTIKHNYILNRLGKLTPAQETKKARNKKKKLKQKNRKKGEILVDPENPNPTLDKDEDDEEENNANNETVPSPSKKSKKESKKSLPKGGQRSSKVDDDLELEQLKKEMEDTRKRRLQEENDHEDRYISKMEKKLKLNKKAKIPASFKVDGLDYLLELCQSSGSKSKKGKSSTDKNISDDEEHDDDDSMSDEDGDENLSDNEEESDMFEDEMQGSRDEESDDGFESPDESLSKGDSDQLEEGQSEKGDIANEMSGDDSEDDLAEDSENLDEIEADDDSIGNTEENKVKSKSKKKEKKAKDDGIWEDIYGRMRRKDGSVIEDNSPQIESISVKGAKAASGKYVPPMKRQNQNQREKITRVLKGLLNRLSEANMHTISKQVEELYMTNSRNEMNECVLEMLYAVLLRTVTMPERVILEHVMLIVILHANIGTEIGAFFLQNFVQDFRTRYDKRDGNDDSNCKELENLILLITSLYLFKVVDACLVYDILNLLAANFTATDVELILPVLRTVGFRLRKDDPLALKSLIILIQQKATAAKSNNLSSAKVKFMMEVLVAIRNNNMSKIPNFDPSVGEHLQKNLKSHIHKGNYVSVMKIKMEDLLNAETKGRWWIVGSAWSNTGSENNTTIEISGVEMTSLEKQKNEQLLKKARKLGMNTETRKNIFCILMTAEDYLDAFEKLSHLDLKNNQDREIVHVTIYCCLHEKKFNPYYGLIAAKFCTSERKFMLALQFNLWDRLKDLNGLKPYQLINLAKLLVHLINDKSLPLSTLKVIEYAEMDKVKLKFLKEVLSGILLQKDEENMQEIFLKSAMSDKLNLFRESLRLFMCHFMLQPTVLTSDGENVGCEFDSKTMTLLKARIKVAETTISLGKSRVQL